MEIITFNINDLISTRDKVFVSQGVNPASDINEKIQEIYSLSSDLFTQLAQPVAIVSNVGIDEFADIYFGEGHNEINNILMKIYPRATYLSLFALTIGEEISTKIELLFQQNKFLLGYMLDTIASLAADLAAEILERNTLKLLHKENQISENTRVLSYSPGYCGWHISGQKKLFAYLNPEKIGISLNANYLMSPLKSVSGVLVAGCRDIHLFTPNYPFCKSCKTHSCLQRMKQKK
jgi:hypothetical protein